MYSLRNELNLENGYWEGGGEKRVREQRGYRYCVSNKKVVSENIWLDSVFI